MTGSAWEIGVHLDALACCATPLLLTAEMGDATELGAAFFACPSSTWFDIDIIIYERHYHVQKGMYSAVAARLYPGRRFTTHNKTT